MDARLIAVINRLSEDLGAMEKAMARTQNLLREILHQEARKNGKETLPPDKPFPANQAFLANQFPRIDGAYPQRAWRENDEEQ